jgi:hypothetical protein
MAKSLRSKREKRLRTLRREIAEPFYDKKEAAKLAAQAAALEAPKVPARLPPQSEDAGSSRAALPSSESAMGEHAGFSGLVTLDCFVISLGVQNFTMFCSVVLVKPRFIVVGSCFSLIW